MNLDDTAALLRKLPAQQEKVVRLYFGLGCRRPHSAEEMAQEFGVSERAIAALLGAAQRRLARDGLTTNELVAAARQQAELHDSTLPPRKSTRARHRHPPS